MKWVAAKLGDTLPANAIKGGRQAKCKTIFVGKDFNNEDFVSKVEASSSNLYLWGFIVFLIVFFLLVQANLKNNEEANGAE